MRRFTPANFAQRERDAILMATASDSEIVDLCKRLGYDPHQIAEHTRRLLVEASSPSDIDVPASMLQLPTLGLLPLHRILLVDDNPTRLTARVAEFRLHQFRLGVVIETATSAEEAVTRLESERFDAVLIELNVAYRNTGKTSIMEHALGTPDSE